MSKIATLACLSINDDSSSGLQSSALIKLAGESLLERQCFALIAAGIKVIVFECPHFGPALKTLAEKLEISGATVSHAADALMLADAVPNDALMLLICHGGVFTDELLQDALGQVEPFIYTRPAASSDERHERIDLEDRWAGCALISGKTIHKLADMSQDGSDWAIVSTVLRLAVQSGVKRVPLEIGPSAEKRIDIISRDEDAAKLEERLVTDRLANVFGKSGAYSGLLSRSIFRPICHKLLPIYWQKDSPASTVALAFVALTLLGLTMAIAGYVIFAAIFAILALATASFLKLTDAFLLNLPANIMLRKLGWGILFISPAVAGFQIGSVEGALAGLLFATVLSLQRDIEDHVRVKHHMDSAAATLILAIGAAIGFPLTSLLLAVSIGALAPSLFQRLQTKLNAI